VVLDAEETAPVKSFRNLPDVSVLPVSAVGVVDVIGHASLVVSASALEGLASRAGETERGAQEG
jgi:ribosomal protein L4